MPGVGGGKTGTTDNGLQTWMVGATTKVGFAVWVGNANGLLPMYDVDLPLAAGSQTRHVLFNEIIGHAMSTYGGGAFPEYVEDEDRNRCYECGDEWPCCTERALNPEVTL